MISLPPSLSLLKVFSLFTNTCFSLSLSLNISHMHILRISPSLPFKDPSQTFFTHLISLICNAYLFFSPPPIISHSLYITIAG